MSPPRWPSRSRSRSQYRSRSIPSTWRENGVGVHGESGGFAYRAYAISGFNGSEFSSSGLRGGRQKGNRAASDDLAFVGRVDYVDTPGLLAGFGFYHGGAAQGSDTYSDLAATIVEVHADYKEGPFHARALYAMANIDGAEEFNTAMGAGLAEELNGGYVEFGYDLLAATDGDRQDSLTPFVRYETIDTQASVPNGTTADESKMNDIVTLGVNYKPIDRLVFKLDYESWDDANDVWNFLVGWSF